MNPWEQTILNRCRSVLRFGLWTTLVINGAILAVFSVLFLFFLCWRCWGWLYRELFSQPW